MPVFKYRASGTYIIASNGTGTGDAGYQVIVTPKEGWTGSVTLKQNTAPAGSTPVYVNVAYQNADTAVEVAAGTAITTDAAVIVSPTAGDLIAVVTVPSGAVNISVNPASLGVTNNELMTAFESAGYSTAGQDTTEAMLSVAVADMLGQTFNVKAFGAVGDGVTNDTVALQDALDAAGTSGVVVFPAGIYQCAGLTSAATGQQFVGLGRVILRKNANGAILTHSGDNVVLDHLEFWGDAVSPTFTGDNVVLTGNRPTLLNCASVYAYGRALKATGSKVTLLGSCNIYATADATGTGYDIELGTSGTTTLYHQIHGYVSTQATGGIKLVDTGSHSIVGGQFGKYTLAVGTGPAGVNGGMLQGCRVLGPVTIDVSSSIMVGNQFGASATITYGAGTSGHEYWGNVDSDAVITNSGNQSSVIVRQVSNDGVVGLKFGDDSSAALMRAAPSGGLFTFPQVEIPNNVGYRVMRASPNATSRAGVLLATASDNVQVVADVGSVQVAVPSGQLVQFVVNSVVRSLVSASGLHIGAATTAPFLSSGIGTPEAAVTAPVGSVFLRTDGGASTALYVKETGTGNTGWIAK